MEIEPGLEERIQRSGVLERKTIADAIGLKFTVLRRDLVMGTLPVDERTVQPFGLLHGGASVVLAESLASVGAWLNLPSATGTAVGIEINANHVRSARSGIVTGEARPIHIGRSTQVWQITILDESQKLICTSRCTIMTTSGE